MGKNKIIDIIDGNGEIMTINTKRLDCVYIIDRGLRFAFSKNIIKTEEYNSTGQAKKVKKDFVSEWMRE